MEPETQTPPDDRRVVMVTGGQGFIGYHLIKHILTGDPDALVINVDSGQYAAANGTRFILGRYAACRPVADKEAINYIWCENSLIGCDDSRSTLRWVMDKYKPHVIYHLAAESHVDRSIDSAMQFTYANVAGTQSLLELARTNERLEKFVYVSTDEVYGDLPASRWVAGNWIYVPRGFVEYCPLNPRNPYAASKASAEHVCMAYYNTYGVPVVITRGCNTFGTFQFPEKFIPVICDNIVNDRKIPVYGDGQQKRQWMHVDDHVEGIVLAGQKGKVGEAYNLGTAEPQTNMWVVELALQTFNKPRSLIEYVQDRPGHDRYYWINSGKAYDELGWEPYRSPTPDNTRSLAETMGWYGTRLAQRWIKLTGHKTESRLGLCSKESS